jgi:hypothetical protein
MRRSIALTWDPFERPMNVSAFYVSDLGLGYALEGFVGAALGLDDNSGCEQQKAVEWPSDGPDNPVR